MDRNNITSVHRQAATALGCTARKTTRWPRIDIAARPGHRYSAIGYKDYGLTGNVLIASDEDGVLEHSSLGGRVRQFTTRTQLPL